MQDPGIENVASKIRQQTSREWSRKSLDELLARFRRPLYVFFAKRLPPEVEVDDLVQEVFVRLAARKDLDQIKQPDGYIFQIAMNLLRDRARKDASHCVDAHDTYDDSTHSHVDLSPERVLLGKEAVGAFVEAIKNLPERTRAVFLLRRYEGLRYGDIARRLGLSVSSVEKHMQKAVKYLDRVINRE